MTIRKEKLAYYKKELTNRREALAADLRQATVDLLADEPFFADSVDQATADSSKTIELAVKNRERENLVAIDEALKRIEEGTFGICDRCDEAIAEARIKAFPFTTLCIDCKAELESESGRIAGRI